jgi:TusA-related sulfurtransferase
MITRALRDVASGGTVHITTDDRAFPKDVAAWCEHQGHELVELISTNGVYDATIRRGAK